MFWLLVFLLFWCLLFFGCLLCAGLGFCLIGYYLLVVFMLVVCLIYGVLLHKLFSLFAVWLCGCSFLFCGVCCVGFTCWVD